jgi:hypothetical protein
MQRSCPTCGSFDVRRSKTGEDDDHARKPFQVRYRCRQCRSVFRAVSTEGARLAIVAIAVGTLLVAGVGTFAAVAYFGGPSEGTALDIAPDRWGDGPETADGVDAERILAARKDAGGAAAFSDDERIASLERAAADGNLDAQYALATTLLNGQWGPQGNRRGAEWLRRAAERGYGLAQLQLGRLYRAGVGVEANDVKAYVWLNLAAEQRIRGADVARDAILDRLTPTEIKHAQAELRRIGEGQHLPSTPTR